MMGIWSKKTQIMSLGLACAVVVFSCTAALAFSFSPSASIQIVEPFGLSEQQQLSFATITKPENQVVIEVTPDGAIGPNTTANVVGGVAPSAGMYTIAGSTTQTIRITASSVGNVAGLNFSALTGKYDGGGAIDLASGATGLVPPGSGKNLALGGALVVESSIATGTFTPQISLEIEYE